MPTNLSATLTAIASVSFSNTNPLGNATQIAEIKEVLNIANGTGANQADLFYGNEVTVADGATSSLDLAGVLTSIYGATITAVEIVALVIANRPKSGAANTTALTIGGGTNAIAAFANAAIPIGPGGVFFVADMDASGIGSITAATGDILRVVNASGAANTFQIIAVCRSA